MREAGPTALEQPVFRRCVRCGYSLRGLPADHACPECGLGFDRHCALYRVTNPKAVFFFALCFVGCWITGLRQLGYLLNWSTVRPFERFLGLTGIITVAGMAALIGVTIARYRRPQQVAVTTDGLIVDLMGFKNDLIPWSKIAGAEVKDRPADKPQIATVTLKDSGRKLSIGGQYNVFPTREDVERFVQQVRQRIAAATVPE